MTQPTLFDQPPAVTPLPERIRTMHAAFGSTPGHTCAQCAHLQRFRQGGTWYKCLQTDHTAGSASTDWRTRWPACGLFEERYPKSPRTAP